MFGQEHGNLELYLQKKALLQEVLMSLDLVFLLNYSVFAAIGHLPLAAVNLVFVTSHTPQATD